MRIALLFSLLLCSSMGFAQKNVTTFGIQFKPIITSKFFDTGQETILEEGIEYTFTPKLGYNFGMLIRRGFTKNLSLETGISVVRRNYVLSHYDEEYDTELDLDFAFVGYEIPVQGLFYVQLGSDIWMNASGGVSFDFYPSNIYSTTSDSKDTLNYKLEQSTFRFSWVQLALVTNLGFEYRTKKDGYFYLGASFHQPFGDMALTRATYTLNRVPHTIENKLSGSYLTVDVRYFFNEKPERK